MQYLLFIFLVLPSDLLGGSDGNPHLPAGKGMKDEKRKYAQFE